MRRLGSLPVLLVLYFLLSSCQPQHELEYNRFGASFITLNNPFYIAVNEGIKEIVDPRGDKVLSFDPSLDIQRQVAQINYMIQQGVDAIFLTPVDRIGITPALEQARAAGIPVINIDSPVYDQSLVEVLVASDNKKAGLLVAEEVKRRKESADIILLEHSSMKTSIDRTQTFVDAFAGDPRYNLLVRESSDGEMEFAHKITERLLPLYPTVEVIMGLNDPTALGAMAAVEASGLEGEILIYGVDGAPYAKKMIKEGKIAATVAQSPLELGRVAAQAAYSILSEERVPDEIIVPVFLINQDNVDEYGIQGWQ